MSKSFTYPIKIYSQNNHDSIICDGQVKLACVDKQMKLKKLPTTMYEDLKQW